MIQSNPLITYADKINGTKPNATGIVTDANMNELKNGILALQTEMLKFGIIQFEGTNLAEYIVPAGSLVLLVQVWNDGNINLIFGDLNNSDTSNNNIGCGFLITKYVSEQTALQITGLGEIKAALIIANNIKP